MINMERFFSFNGLTQRSEYWAVMVVTLVAGFFLGFGIGGLFMAESTAILGFILFSALFVASAWLTLATTARRCRDAGVSPYWCLAMLVPYVSFVATIVFGIIPSDHSQIANEFE